MSVTYLGTMSGTWPADITSTPPRLPCSPPLGLPRVKFQQNTPVCLSTTSFSTPLPRPASDISTPAHSTEHVCTAYHARRALVPLQPELHSSSRLQQSKSIPTSPLTGQPNQPPSSSHRASCIYQPKSLVVVLIEFAHKPSTYSSVITHILSTSVYDLSRRLSLPRRSPPPRLGLP